MGMSGITRSQDGFGNQNLPQMQKDFDTGKAALIAYTNLDQLAVDDVIGDNWHHSPQTRNNFGSQSSADGSSKVIT